MSLGQNNQARARLPSARACVSTLCLAPGKRAALSMDLSLVSHAQSGRPARSARHRLRKAHFRHLIALPTSASTWSPRSIRFARRRGAKLRAHKIATVSSVDSCLIPRRCRINVSIAGTFIGPPYCCIMNYATSGWCKTNKYALWSPANLSLLRARRKLRFASPAGSNMSRPGGFIKHKADNSRALFEKRRACPN